MIDRRSARCLLASLSFATMGLVGQAASGQTVLFEDDFDAESVTAFNSGVNATSDVGTTGWTFIGQEEFQNQLRYGIDYSTLNNGSIPEAPNSDPGDVATTGVALQTNIAGGRRDQAAIYYDDASFTGQYRVSVDMYLSWAAEPGANAGTTEHAGLFIGKDTPTNPALTDDEAEGFTDRAYPASAGAGALFSSDGDTTNFDHLLLKNNVYPSTDSGQYSVNDFGFGTQLGYDATDVNTDPLNGEEINLPELLPGLTTFLGISQNPGVVGYRWVTLVAEVDTEALGNGTGTELGTTTFSVEIPESGESFTLGTLDNSVIEDLPDGPLLGFDDETEQGPVDMAGRVTLTLIDFFPSVNSDFNLAFALFDNLIVTEVVDDGLDGDYNDDGVVNAADYTTWRDAGEPDGLAGYNLWADNYGASSGGSPAIPEPTSALLLLTAVAGGLSRRR